MGRFKKTDQIFAHLNTTLLNSNVLRGRDRPSRKEKKCDRLSIIYLQFRKITISDHDY